MEWILEICFAVLRALAQPFVYLFIGLLLVSGYYRIKQDRQSFGIKIFSYFDEQKRTWQISLISGLLLSIISVGIGFVVTWPLIILLATVVAILSLFRRFFFLSASYIIGISYIAAYVITQLRLAFLPSNWIDSFEQINFNYIPLLIALLLIIEGILLSRTKPDDTYPEITKSLRGKYLGRHRMKKIALVPFFALLPAGMIEPFAEWWPFLQVNGESYGLILIPYIVGFEHAVRNSIPKHGARWIATKVFILASVMVVLSIVSYFYQVVVVISAIIAIAGRLIIQYWFRMHDQNQQSVFKLGGEGIFVLGVMPNSTAAHLQIEPGDRIVKVNGIPVTNEHEFYHAVQQNRAFCKLAIIDLNGEIRFSKSPLFEDDHHELGVLLVKDNDPIDWSTDQQSTKP
ncbi:PDZ domain-containing protein [Gracilibacillus xinjiangensis]|uniref:PDZ domain-containing protein n=1 Tax=Gracilibacillus xinjiangensis TaxID=1193282 RepID=A0ABV8WYJ6_9BACI